MFNMERSKISSRKPVTNGNVFALKSLKLNTSIQELGTNPSLIAEGLLIKKTTTHLTTVTPHPTPLNSSNEQPTEIYYTVLYDSIYIFLLTINNILCLLLPTVWINTGDLCKYEHIKYILSRITYNY